MIQKQNDATPNRPQGERPLDADYIHLSFAERIRQLKSEKAWQDRDRNSITLVHHPRMRVVLLALHKDALLKTHTSDGPITIQPLEGEIEVMVSEKPFTLRPMEALVVDDQIPHSVLALEESVFLLTMGPGVAKTF